jgi:hypothetical protein
MLERRTLQSWALAAVAAGGALLIMFLPELTGARSAPPGDRESVLVSTACTAAGIAWACAFAVASYRKADEFAQQRSKFSWYWGSMIGIVTATPAIVFVGLNGLHLLDPAAVAGPALVRAFKLGLILPLGSQVLGAVAVTFWWKATRR